MKSKKILFQCKCQTLLQADISDNKHVLIYCFHEFKFKRGNNIIDLIDKELNKISIQLHKPATLSILRKS